MRGKLALEIRAVREERIIPAHAGQTWLVAVMVIILSDHPRACEANLELVESCVLDAGSSPRMRGKPEM